MTEVANADLSAQKINEAAPSATDGSPLKQPSTSQIENFDKKLQDQTNDLNETMKSEAQKKSVEEEDSDLYDNDGNFDPLVAKAKGYESYKIAMEGLESPDLENNELFKKLKRKIQKFFIEAERVRIKGLSPALQDLNKYLGIEFAYLKKLNWCLKKMLREVINCEDKDNRPFYLKRVYEWYVKTQVGIGMLDKKQFELEQDILNPQRVVERDGELMNKVEEARLIEMDEVRRQAEIDYMFAEGMRTEHKGILPARDRIKNYKIKTIRPKGPTSANPTAIASRQLAQQRLLQVKSTEDFTKKDGRPTTAAQSALSVAQTAATPGGLGASESLANSLALNARAVSFSRFSNFEEQERAVKKHAFPCFYTKGMGDEEYQEADFHKENRFEGKSSYTAHKPSGLVFEQELEKFFIDEQQKELAEKRRDEEGKEMVREWGMARGRVESEIQRKKEHQREATNFKEARGWVRRNWKTKLHDHRNETMDDFLCISDNSDDDQDNGGMESSRAHSIKNSARTLQKQKSIKEVKFVDLTADGEAYGFRPTTSVQREQLQSIFNQNDKLPPKKKKKETLPEISTNNMYMKHAVAIEQKKKKAPPELKVVQKYYNIGLVDPSLPLYQDEQKNTDAAGFRLRNMMLDVQHKAGKQKIRNLRQSFGKLIGTKDDRMASAKNLWHIYGEDKISQGEALESISLSCFSKPKTIARPRTAAYSRFGTFLGMQEEMQQENIVKGVPGLKPVLFDEEGNPIVQEEAGEPEEMQQRIANMDLPPELKPLQRTFSNQTRVEGFLECRKIKEKLAKDGCQVSMNTLERAVMVPGDMEFLPGEKKYPMAGDGLMENPFPKPKKKGKKKKGKK